MEEYAESWECSVCLRNFDIKIPIGIEINLPKEEGIEYLHPYRYGTYYGTYRVCFPCWLNYLGILPSV